MHVVALSPGLIWPHAADEYRSTNQIADVKPAENGLWELRLCGDSDAQGRLRQSLT